jgi:hypothetical protein
MSRPAQDPLNEDVFDLMRFLIRPWMLPPIAFSFQMPHHTDRPTKVCPVCGRPFQWRKKWKDVWEEVRYCSDRCRNQRKRITSTEDSNTSP